MTLPDERYRALTQTYELLLDLQRRGNRVPQQFRDRARSCLRHYPTGYDLELLEDAAPHILQQQMEPLYKMLKQHEMADSITEDYRQAGLIPDDHEGSTPD